MVSLQKKIGLGALVLIVGGGIGFFVYQLTSSDEETRPEITEVVEDPTFEGETPEQEIADFAEGVTATEFEDNSFTFDTEVGQTSISTEIPADYPNDAPNLKAEIISAARSDSVETRKMFTVFWESEESYEKLQSTVSEIVQSGWEKINEDFFENSEYIRFEKDGRRLDFSLADGETGKREVMVMVEE